MTLPGLEAARCVHALLPNAGCSACVDACPRGAWVLDESALRFTAEACDGCGLCVPRCPQQAIGMPLAVETRSLAGGVVMLARCERSGDGGESGRVPCLHAIGVTDLLRGWREGRRAWLVRQGDCDRCERGCAERLSERVTQVNTLLEACGLPQILLREISPAAWQGLADRPVSAAASRRRFFATLRSRPAAALTGRADFATRDCAEAPGTLLPDGVQARLPWVVGLDTARCIACHACARVCPQQAIEVVEGDAAAYRLHHRRCTGCGLCRDVCEHHAIAPQAFAEAGVEEIVLETRECAACRVRFQVPVGRPVSGLCWVCARSRPVRSKRQVMA